MKGFLLDTRGKKEEQASLMAASDNENMRQVALSMPIGCEDFEKLRKSKYYYIDKTGVLAELLRDSATVALFTRPRRFGKTLTMSMLEYFLSIEKKEVAPSLFEGLEIMKNDAEFIQIRDQWMNKYPIIYLSLKDVYGETFEDTYRVLQTKIKNLFTPFKRKFLSHSASNLLDEEDVSTFLLLQKGSKGGATQDVVEDSLRLLCQMAHNFYGQKPILLIDEYDVPISYAEKNGYYSKMINLIRKFFSAALKGNNDIERAILTGCLRISKESIFTGLNNLRVYDISNADFSDLFGFTPSEVRQLLEDTGFSSMEDTIREWYDGYRFGKRYWQKIFCPWDVINYIKDLSGKNASEVKITPPLYWKNSSGNDIIDRLKEEGIEPNIVDIENLLAGKCISVELDQQPTYKNLYSYTGKEDNEERRNRLWTVFYMTGYLTLASPEQKAESDIEENPDETALVIPNREIRKLFENLVKSWNRKVSKENGSELFQAFWEGSTEKATAILNDILKKTASFHETSKESFYQILLQGMAIGAGYKKVSAEQESGDGYYDLAVQNDAKEVIIFELKYDSTGGRRHLQGLLRNALKQLKQRRYGENLEAKRLLLYGIAFIKKDCLVGKLEDLTETDLSSLS